ncbi:hypothetical protein TSUD_07130 [Trifolium subterraneum]|uniref:RING-type E3 ubiquitin transferase n=1 Tax=Trifolium subterraneum TaxID=3900 RepID=A0A2Z6LNM2_TRISU|nr:hypothetical protein TSUD_07130 [Trifolium subterraneum]
MKEAVVDHSDIARGLLEYAKRNHIQTIIVGAPASYTKNVLSRSLNMRTISKRFKGYEDIATTIIKSAPDYSSVYVIAKGKVVETRPAISPLDNLDVKSPAMSPAMTTSKSENDSPSNSKIVDFEP